MESKEWTKAVEAARDGESDAADFEARLRTLFATETDRVATAMTLAEVLAPLLSERLHGKEPARDRRRGDPAPLPLRPNDAMPTIADFIDQMLEHETAAAPPSRVR